MNPGRRLPLDVIDDGFDCPECGCRASALVARKETPTRVFKGGRLVATRLIVYETRACEHCATEYALQFERDSLEDPAAQQRGQDGLPGKVVYGAGTVPMKGAKCPRCGRFPVKVVGSGPKVERGEPRIRSHKCKCGWKGQSVE